MYQVKPRGINIKQNDRDVPDGFLQESINLQWRDGAYRPIPDRINYPFASNPSTIIDNANEIILHKVSDEDKINVLVFTGASPTAENSLYWIGTIENGVYTAKPSAVGIVDFPGTDTVNLSFTVLNGLVYFMNDNQNFYYRLQFNETDEVYEAKDMYKYIENANYFYPKASNYSATAPKSTNNLVTQCGVICYRFTLVLDTGEEVLHSPIYASLLGSLNRSSGAINKDDTLDNIHTIIPTNIQFPIPASFQSEISAINIYATRAFYISKLTIQPSTGFDTRTLVASDIIKGEVQKLSEEPFYLIKTLDNPGSSSTNKPILLYVDKLDNDIAYGNTEMSQIDISAIAAGSVMPVDNFTSHKLFGKVKSSNGRLTISTTKTLLSQGSMANLSVVFGANSKSGYVIDTEDGQIENYGFQYGVSPLFYGGDKIECRGIISYPDSRGLLTGSTGNNSSDLRLYKLRANKSHNISCAFDFIAAIWDGFSISEDGSNINMSMGFTLTFSYGEGDVIKPNQSQTTVYKFYTSENRIQFSEAGEFSVWPAINSYRVGNGRIQFVGDNSVDPSNSDYIAPLLIGTSDGIYTVNFDTSGQTLVQSITKAANMPAVSSENIQIDQNLIYVSDKGLIAINSGALNNLTSDYFPDQGNGDFPVQNNVYPNYNLLTDEWFQGANPYVLSDIVDYLRGALFAYDGRRNNLWCCNPTKNFSLIYNLATSQWDMCTFTFDRVIDLYSIVSAQSDEFYSRYIVRKATLDKSTYVLSGEEQGQTQVRVHMLTRPIKISDPDVFKKVERFITRGQLIREDINGYFYCGLWGKQDINKKKVNIPLAAFKDDTDASWPNLVRQDIPIGRQKGKYKTLSLMVGGLMLPDSSIDSFDIVAMPVDNKVMR